MAKTTTESNATQAVEDDFFADVADQGIDPNPRVRQPYITPRNKSQKPCWILPKDCARDAGWLNYRNEQWVEHEYAKSADLALYIFEPRVIIIAATPDLAFNKKDEDFLGVVDWNTYVHDKEENKIVRKFLVMLLDKDNMPLHQKPLQYSANKTAGGSFTRGVLGGKDKKMDGSFRQFRGFYQELEEAIAERYERSNREFQLHRTHFDSVERVLEPWHNVSVYCPKFAPETRGNPDDSKQQSVCCITTDYEHPTPENCHLYYAKHLKPVVSALIADNSDWGKRFTEAAKVPEILPYQEYGVVKEIEQVADSSETDVVGAAQV